MGDARNLNFEVLRASRPGLIIERPVPLKRRRVLSRIRSRIRACNTIINNATNIHLTTLQETRDENYLKKNK